MNHVVLISYLSNSFRSLRTPTVPAKRPDINQLRAIGSNARLPLEISLVESSPPYEPSHPATASISTEIQHRASVAVSVYTRVLKGAPHAFPA